jgi:hypothetical protein
LAKRNKLPPAPDDPRAREQEQFFDEVAEELKQERYAALWKRYGRLVVALAVVIVVAVAGYQYWRQQQQSARMAASERFTQALSLQREGKLKEAQEAFAAAAHNAPSGYSALARLHQAALFLKAGDKSAAFGAYEQLAGDDSIDPLFRDAAVLQWAYAGLDDSDAAQMIERLRPLTAAESPWRHLAREFTALYSERAGRRADAVRILTELEKDKDAPAGVRSRSRELLAMLGKS